MNKIASKPFGKVYGKEIDIYTLRNAAGITARLISYGAALVSLEVPDKKGKLDNIVLGFDTLDEYAQKSPYFGATIGRFANRIAQGKFTLDGIEYQLAQNQSTNHLHGGLKGYDKVIWDSEPFTGEDYAGVKFKYKSPDGEENYPGNLEVEVAYILTDKNELKINFTAITDKPTPINLTHHSYFNLSGAGCADILNHQMTIFADRYLPIDANLIPTGEIAPVKDTAFDFTSPHRIGDRISQSPIGYDHNFVLNKSKGCYCLAAKTIEPQTGRVMETYTTEPGIQFYAGNQIDNIKGSGGKTYGKYGGFCLEPQHFPDSVNQPHFPSAILRPGQTYKHNMAYVFSIAK